ncbi:MAG: diversity-generating retroelement protein Avd, partial [Patescibacteria group bacterium]
PPPPRHFSEPSIIHKAYKFYIILYFCTKQFPKKDRFTIGKKCEQILLEILELLFDANAKYGTQRIFILKKIDIKLKILKIMVRLAFDVKVIDQKKYISLEKELQEIGKMLGGWIKSSSNKVAQI